MACCSKSISVNKRINGYFNETMCLKSEKSVLFIMQKIAKKCLCWDSEFLRHIVSLKDPLICLLTEILFEQQATNILNIFFSLSQQRHFLAIFCIIKSTLFWYENSNNNARMHTIWHEMILNFKVYLKKSRTSWYHIHNTPFSL